MNDYFQFHHLIAYAVAYGVTMKIADLTNEHGLKWFKGDALIFGILWGFFGTILIMSNNNELANILLAMNIALLTRNRLDYINHQIASSIIIISFLFIATFSPTIFLIFYLLFLIFGSMKDYIDDVLKKEGLFHLLNEIMLYYPVPTFIYCIIYANWIIFWVFLFYTIAYNLTKYIGKKYNYH